MTSYLYIGLGLLMGAFLLLGYIVLNLPELDLEKLMLGRTSFWAGMGILSLWAALMSLGYQG